MFMKLLPTPSGSSLCVCDSCCSFQIWMYDMSHRHRLNFQVHIGVQDLFFIYFQIP
jgi:hypothetical protein